MVDQVTERFNARSNRFFLILLLQFSQSFLAESHCITAINFSVVRKNHSEVIQSTFLHYLSFFKSVSFNLLIEVNLESIASLIPESWYNLSDADHFKILSC